MKDEQKGKKYRKKMTGAKEEKQFDLHAHV